MLRSQRLSNTARIRARRDVPPTPPDDELWLNTRKPRLGRRTLRPPNCRSSPRTLPNPPFSSGASRSNRGASGVREKLRMKSLPRCFRIRGMPNWGTSRLPQNVDRQLGCSESLDYHTTNSAYQICWTSLKLQSPDNPKFPNTIRDYPKPSEYGHKSDTLPKKAQVDSLRVTPRGCSRHNRISADTQTMCCCRVAGFPGRCNCFAMSCSQIPGCCDNPPPSRLTKDLRYAGCFEIQQLILRASPTISETINVACTNKRTNPPPIETRVCERAQEIPEHARLPINTPNMRTCRRGDRTCLKFLSERMANTPGNLLR